MSATHNESTVRDRIMEIIVDIEIDSIASDSSVLEDIVRNGRFGLNEYTDEEFLEYIESVYGDNSGLADLIEELKCSLALEDTIA